MSNNNKSIIFYNGLQQKSFCGYCKTDYASYSNGMWASSLTVQAYQDMIDRGWRRSGKYCYKSLMDTTCCPLYTIRCEALDFQLSKSQKKIIKKLTKFLKSGICDKNPISIEQDEREPLMKYEPRDAHNEDTKIQVDQLYMKGQNSSVNDSKYNNLLITNEEDSNAAVSVNLNCKSKVTKEIKKVKPGEGADPSLPRCKKRKLLRIEKKLLKNPNSLIKTLAPEQKSLEDFIIENDSVFTNEGYKLRIKLLKLTPSSSSFEDEYAVYRIYQTIVHGDTDDLCTKEQFIRFLVNSPLHFEEADHPDHPGYGSFHQQYWLGDKLVAVGVIDILPKCISSVYLFYDPDYHNLVLGTYSTLREICLVRQLYKMSPELKYYYMGFYIHTCPKMRYKAKFEPSYLLCPLRYTWHAIDKCIQKLDNEKYSIFNESENICDDNNTQSIIENIPVLYSGTLMSYTIYKRLNKKNQDELITEYAKLVGPKLARQLIYCFLD
ncbi:Hypothetical protein CINCED_3A002030 [Cinara cedri]|uniref:Arginyl-tRNA--protein transferase 1 n=1 Tax=Cinara cedri TaxID=506608 RepID=A0A5E4MTU8_9HEMI|nr:Hypothetical protein CINCED_3A002030 [Cinara cedri]